MDEECSASDLADLPQGEIDEAASLVSLLYFRKRHLACIKEVGEHPSHSLAI